MNCWTNLESFNDFYCRVASNYGWEVKEEKYMKLDEIYEPEEDLTDKILEPELIKVEMLSENTVIATEWTMENEATIKKESPKKSKKVQSKLKTISTLPPILSPVTLSSSYANPSLKEFEDDQRVRDSAEMNCEICNEEFDTLRDAKTHYISNHEVKGYIMCCNRY